MNAKTKIITVGVDLTNPNLQKMESNVVDQFLIDWLKSISSDELFGVTCTFKKQYHIDDPYVLNDYVRKTLSRSRSWKALKGYILYPEFSKLNGNLHYHGVVHAAYQANFMKAVTQWRRVFGYCKPELNICYYYCGNDLHKRCTQRDRSRANWCWIHYIRKDRQFTGLSTIYKKG